MARKSASNSSGASKNEADAVPGILPLPEPVIRHHGQTLWGPMRKWAQQGRVPPVLLLTGTAGSGKRSVGYWLAQWILCEQAGFAKLDRDSAPSQEEDLFGQNRFDDTPTVKEVTVPEHPGPCGQCLSCQRALKGHWVDFTEILPEDSDGETVTNGTLKVDQFRKVKASLGFGAHEGAFKIILIPNADRMTVQAANSVLKLLEEPPPGWVFFLTASDPTLVLPTILSRCQALRLKPLTCESLHELLSLANVTPSRAAVCAELAQGSWSRAITLSSDVTWEHRQALFGFIQEPASQLSLLVDWASQEPGHFNLLVDQLEQLTSELVRWTISPNSGDAQGYPWISTDGKSALIAHAQGVLKKQGSLPAAREFWTARALRLARSRQESLAPLNRKLLIQDLLLPWLQAM